MSRSSESNSKGNGKGNRVQRIYSGATHHVAPGKKSATHARYGENATAVQMRRDAIVQRKAEVAAEDGDQATGGENAAGAAEQPAGQLVIAKPKQDPEGGIVADDDVSVGAAPAPASAPAPSAAPVQGKGDIGSNASDTSSVQQTAERGVAGSGGSLPHLGAVQMAFGTHDVSGVKAHTSAAAADACKTINAEAYASGSDVAFASAAPSLHTAAHEAAHVVQQRGGVQLKGGVGQVGDVYEKNADEVADRVVQGKSAVDLLDPFSGGGAGTSVQRKETAADAAPANAPAGNSPASSPAPAATAATQHYEVELKAWIPHAKVVDPEEPMRASDWLDTISSLANTIAGSLPGVQATLKYNYHSYYRGDNHAGYSGGHRVLSRASFDWDGTTVTKFKQSGSYGTTHRDYDYRAWLDISAGIGPFRKSLYTKTIVSGSNTEAATASSATSGSATSTGFNLGFASANPVVMVWAPDIDSSLRGTLDAAGNVSMGYTTDLFPSHGIQVKKNGAVLKTEIVNDASGVNGLGIIGAADIGRRLTSFSNTGSTSAP